LKLVVADVALLDQSLQRISRVAWDGKKKIGRDNKDATREDSLHLGCYESPEAFSSQGGFRWMTII
jgi:hypothetical protein